MPTNLYVVEVLHMELGYRIHHLLVRISNGTILNTWDWHVGGSNRGKKLLSGGGERLGYMASLEPQARSGWQR
jgi:hypothetical protein